MRPIVNILRYHPCEVARFAEKSLAAPGVVLYNPKI